MARTMDRFLVGAGAVGQCWVSWWWRRPPSLSLPPVRKRVLIDTSADYALDSGRSGRLPGCRNGGTGMRKVIRRRSNLPLAAGALLLGGCASISYKPSLSLGPSPVTIHRKVQVETFRDESPP